MLVTDITSFGFCFVAVGNGGACYFDQSLAQLNGVRISQCSAGTSFLCYCDVSTSTELTSAWCFAVGLMCVIEAGEGGAIYYLQYDGEMEMDGVVIEQCSSSGAC